MGISALNFQAAEPFQPGTVSPDELAKIRLWHLLAQSEQIMRQTLFADTKAATLLAMIGLIATKIALDLAPGQFGVVIGCSFALKAAVMAMCLGVIMPRFPGRAAWPEIARSERFSWTALANPVGPREDYALFGAGAEAPQIYASVARANQDASCVLRQKFALLRRAFQLAIADVAVMLVILMQFKLG